MKSLRSVYLNVQPKTKIIVLLSALLLTFGVAINVSLDIVSALLFTTGALVLVDSLLRNHRFLLTLLITLVFIGGAYSVGVVLTTIYSAIGGIDFLLGSATFIWSIFLAVCLYIFVASRFSRGRVWVNLSVSYALFLATIASVVVLTNASSMGPGIVVSLGLVAGLLWLIARAFIYKRTVLEPVNTSTKLANLVQDSLLSFSAVKAVRQYDGELGSKFLVALTEYRAYAVFPLESQRDLSLWIDRGQLKLGSEDLAPQFESLLLESKALAHELGVSPATLTPMMFLHSPKTTMPYSVFTVKPRKKQQIDRVLGTVYVSNRAGFKKKLQWDQQGRKLSKRTAARLQNALGQPEDEVTEEIL